MRNMQIGMPDIVKGNDFPNPVHIAPNKFGNRAVEQIAASADMEIVGHQDIPRITHQHDHFLFLVLGLVRLQLPVVLVFAVAGHLRGCR